MKKHNNICLLASAALLLSTFSVAGCNLFKSDSSSTSTESSEVTVTAIAIEVAPRTEFKTTSTFSVDGGKIKATKSDGSSEVVDMTIDMIPTYPDLTTPGTKSVTVKYQNITTSYDITVIEWDQKVPEITFTGDYAESGFTLKLEDTWNITFTVTEGVEYDWYYTANDGEVNLGKTQPTEAGTYAINVVTVENEDYVSKSAFRWFKAISGVKQNPVISFAEEYETSGFTVKLEDDWGNFGLTVTEGVEYDWYFTANDGAVNLGKTQPTEAGTYAINVVTVETDTYNRVSTFRWFYAVSGAKQDAEITWNGDCAESGFTRYIGEEWSFDYTVTEGATYDWHYEKDEVSLGKTQPTEAGTYVIKVEVEEDDTFRATSSYRWFNVAEKPSEDAVEINYMVVQFDGVDYEASGWGSKEERIYRQGAPAPTINIVTDPAGYGEFVNVWISDSSENEVVGWPTEAGDYTFCVNILASNAKLTKGSSFNGPIYLPFSIIE